MAKSTGGDPRLITRRSALRLIGTTASAVALGACAPSASSPAGVAKPSAAVLQPKSGGTLRVGIVGGLTGTIEGDVFASGTGDYYFTIWDKLIEREFSEAGTPQPMLAESWDISSDFKQQKFNLRKGVQFHSGREFTSDDVKYSITRVQDATIGSGHFAIFANWFAGSAGSIETPDKYTVVLKSAVPRPYVIDFFERLSIVDRDIYTASPKANAKASGTGPFKMAEYVPGDHLTLTKNPNYWQSGRPYLDELTTKFFGDPQSLSVAFETGALDYVLNPLPRDVIRLAKDARYKATVNRLSGWWYFLGANTTNPPTNNKLVRQALAYAVNRERWVTQELGGRATVRSLWWAPSSLAYDASRENFYKFDLDKAKSLLQRSGVTDLVIDFPYSTAFPETASLGQIVQSDLASIGVKVTLRAVDANAFRDDVLTVGRNRFNMGGIPAGSGAVREALVIALISAWFRPGANCINFKSPQYEQIVTSTAQEPDEKKRKELYGQLNDLLIDEAFVVGVASKNMDELMRANVQGARYSMHEAVMFTDVWIDR